MLQAVCAEAVEGVQRLARGGLEVGGILFGVHEAGLTRILAARPIECEHRFGPSFVLSDNDRIILGQMLADWKSEPELAALAPLGCYVSHPRHGAVLTESDVELLDRYLAGTPQIALALVPKALGAVQVSLLARNSEGTHTACHEFEYSIFNAARDEPAPMGRKASRPEGLDPQLALLAGAVAHRAEPVVERFENSHAVPPGNSFLLARSGLLFAVLMLIVCMPGRETPEPHIPLDVRERDGNLIIHWDPSLPTIQHAAKGTLEIQDGRGSAEHIFIGPDVLKAGSISYRRKSDVVEILFTVAGKEITGSEKTIYVAPIGGTDAPSVAQTPPTPVASPVPVDTRAGMFPAPALNAPPGGLPNPNASAIPPTPAPIQQPRSFQAPPASLVATNPANNGQAAIP